MRENEAWKAVTFYIPKSVIEEYGLWQVIWGCDIWIMGVPMLKVTMLSNLLGWALFLALR